MPYITYETDDRNLATVTLDRPDKHNAFNEDVIAELSKVLDDIRQDQDCKLMVLRANGTNFCAGADLDWMQRMAGYTRTENIRDANALAQLLYKLNFLPVPTIARVQGAAMGGGSGLVACCDVALAADDAVFAFSEVKLGLIPATISPYVIRAIGEKQARRYFQTAERFGAVRARELGLVSEVMAASKLDEAVEKTVELIMSNSPAAVRAAKQLAFDVAGRPITPELVQQTSERIAAIRASEQGREGLSAFLEKRKPAWLR
ncbi:MAG: enoyl-CoA hydratase/isomerase family protein [Gammaproteobacteria bacterium]|nr:enoyl-CoA hydratase/isomerase family protein [Gammaproteobacteria bacterium]MCY4339101.1 enoyl-CoA hydratase/isomerase family protein [Gammaproteobacteria bacterium]